MRKKMGMEIKNKVQENVDRFLMFFRLFFVDFYRETEADKLDKKLRQRFLERNLELVEYFDFGSEYDFDCEYDSEIFGSR